MPKLPNPPEADYRFYFLTNLRFALKYFLNSWLGISQESFLHMKDGAQRHHNFRHFAILGILGIFLLFGLSRNIQPSAFALNFSGLVQAEYNVSDFLFVKTGLSLDLGKINSLIRVLDGVQYDINSCQGSFPAGERGFGFAGNHRAFN